MDDGVVYIGGDSAGVSGLDVQVRKDPKVFRNGEYVMGYTSSFRMGQLLAYKMQAPKPPPSERDVYPFMVTAFVEVVRKTLKDGGFTTVKDSVESGGTFLVGVNGQLFAIEDDFQVVRVATPYHVCGCGERYALGALYQSTGMDMTPRQRIQSALKAATMFSGGVRPPYRIVRTR